MFVPRPGANPARQSQRHELKRAPGGCGDRRGGRSDSAFGGAARAQSCPAPLADAKRLVLVTAPSMNDMAATMRLYERASANAAWRALGATEPVTIGRAGMGWSQFFTRLARRDEPLKVEGDKRAPAGLFPIGRSFGILASSRPDYLHVTSDTICVNDVSSPAYNTIASRARVGPAVRAENMSRVLPMYRRGLLVDYPTDAKKQAGSCIFIHVWRSPRPAPPVASRCPSRGSKRCRISPPAAPCWRSCRVARWSGCQAAFPEIRARVYQRPVDRREPSAVSVVSTKFGISAAASRHILLLKRSGRSSGKRCSNDVAPVEAGPRIPGVEAEPNLGRGLHALNVTTLATNSGLKRTLNIQPLALCRGNLHAQNVPDTGRSNSFG